MADDLQIVQEQTWVQELQSSSKTNILRVPVSIPCRLCLAFNSNAGSK